MIDIEVPDSEGKQGQPDYFLSPLGLLVEIKRVFDRAEREVNIQWSRSIDKLKKYINENHKDQLKDSYLIRTPKSVKIKESNKIKIADKILDAIKNQKTTSSINGIGLIEIKKIKSGGDDVVFMSMGEAGLIDSPRTIYENISSKIIVANRQLGAFKEGKIKKRILLLVNHYMFGSREGDFIEALSYSYADLLNCNNIDEIWLQYLFEDGSSTHHFIYSSQFLHIFETQKLTDNREFIELFASWFRPLQNKGDQFKEKCYKTVKFLLKNMRPHDQFENPTLREGIISLGEWHAKNDRIKEATWIVEKFINDPDPGDPALYEGQPEFNYHEIIKEGKATHVIASVLGHLAWLIRYLPTDKKYIERALDYTKTLLDHINLNVKLNAIAPLIEIASRRHLLQGYGVRPRIGSYKEFHNIVFNMVGLIEKEPNYKNLAEFLIRVFSYYKDLSTNEAIQVLNSMKILDDSSGLFIYFGIYRKNHFKDMEIEYNSQKINNMLIDVIKNQEYKDIRAKITHHFWRILADKKKEFTIIKPYLDMIFNTNYHNNTFTSLEYIIKDWIESKPLQCVRWYMMFLKEINRYFENENEINTVSNIWFHDTEYIVKVIAQKKPKYLLETVTILLKLSQKRVIIGNLKTILLSYSLISNEKLKNKLRKEFELQFKNLRQQNPDIEEIYFD